MTRRPPESWNISPMVVLIGICLLAGALMLWAAWTDSAINDEVVHIAAGYDYVRYLTYDLNPEHPPLIKALASASTIFLKPSFPTSSPAITNPTTNEWAVGGEFLYASGNNADMIVRVARLVPIAITLLTIIYICLLSRMLMGPWWSLAPSFLFALDPTILANGHYVTTDVGAAFGIVVATYYYLRHLTTRSVKTLWLAGIAFGIAQLTKFSTIILIPFLFLLYLVLEMNRGSKADDSSRAHQGLKGWLLRDLVYIFLIGYGVVYLVYTLVSIR